MRWRSLVLDITGRSSRNKIKPSWFSYWEPGIVLVRQKVGPIPSWAATTLLGLLLLLALEAKDQHNKMFVSLFKMT